MKPAGEAPGILDLRSREGFLALHLVGAAHVPAAELNDRLFELPPPQGGPDEPAVTLLVVHEHDDEAERDKTVEFLTGKGYTVVQTVHGKDLAGGAHAQEALESGKRFACLWRPNPALDACWERIREVTRNWLGRKVCLDLAAGNGRDCVFVARDGWHVLGIDYQQRQWSKIDSLAQRALAEMPDEEVARFGSVRSNNLDLETAAPAVVADQVLALLGGELPALVIVSRYLHRPLHAVLHRLVAPGGLLLFHTFMEGAQHVGRKTPTKARFLLTPGELRETFQNEFDVLEDRVLLLPDQRPTSCFLAQRKTQVQ
jgi:tellurite methyltransferase